MNEKSQNAETSNNPSEQVLAGLGKQMVEASPSGMILVDALADDMPIVYVNAAFETMTGYSRDEAIGRNCRFLQGDDHDQRDLDIVRDAIKNKQACTVTLRNHRKDGTLFWNELRVSPISDADGQVTHFAGIQNDVTEREEALDQIRTTSANLRAMLEGSQQSFIMLDRNHRVVDFDRQTAKNIEDVFGKQMRRGEDMRAYVADENLDRFMLEYQRALNGEGIHDEITIPGKTKTYYFETHMYPVRDEQDNIIGVCISTIDITERQLAEEALRNSEERLKRAESVAHLGHYEIDIPTGRAIWSDETFRIFGLSSHDKQPDAQSYSQLVHDADREMVITEYDNCVANKEDFDLVYRIVRPDGTVRYVHSIGQFRQMPDGQHKFFGIIQDITERKQREEALHESEKQYRNLFENVMHEVHLWKLVRDEQGAIKTWQLIEANPAALKAWNKNRADIIGKTTDEVFSHNATEQFMPIVKKIFSEGTPYTWEAYFPPTGEFLYMTSVPFGEYFISTGTDITERRQMEDALRKSEELYRLLAEHSHDMIILHKPDGTLIYASPSCERMLGFTHEELFNMPPDATLHPDDIARTAHAHQRVLAERTTVELDYRVRKKDGGYIWVSSFSKPILDENGDVKQLLAVSRDITERKQAEQLELNIERLKASFHKEQEQNALIQRVVSMLSHDLRTPLAVIASSRDMLHRYFDRLSAEAREEKLVRIERQVRFATELLEDAVNTVKGPLNAREFMPRSVDLAVLCQISIDEIQGAQDGDHDMRFINEGDVETVSVDEVLVSRILINLLSNAIKYSPAGSEIRLELDHSEEWIILRVSDQGMGISVDDLPHIFDPFYRADDVHHINGTGLGLNIIKDCVDRHQSRIHVESKLGRGSTFTVELPMQVDSSDQ